MAKILFVPIREKSAMSIEILIIFYRLYLNAKVCIIQAHKRRSNARAVFKKCDDFFNLLIGSVFICTIWQGIDELCLRFYIGLP